MNEPMEHPIIAEALRGDASALDFLRSIALILHTWDDLVDRDSPVDDDDIGRAFTLALVHLPRNGFYQRNFEKLNPILIQSITNWRIATEVERAEDATTDDLTFAFIIRSTYIDLAVMSAAIIGGMDHAVKYGLRIRQWAHEERFDGFLKNLAAEKAARKENDVL
jgi:hypothetical protein